MNCVSVIMQTKVSSGPEEECHLELFLKTSGHSVSLSGHKLRSGEPIFDLIITMDSGFKLLQIGTKLDTRAPNVGFCYVEILRSEN